MGVFVLYWTRFIPCATLRIMSKRISENPNHWSEIMGNPDDWDKKNLQALIDKFCRTKFTVEGQKISGKTYIDLVVAEARDSHQSSDVFNPKNVKSKTTDMRALTTLPPELNKLILEAYPTMFRDVNHSRWFATNFPQFRIAQEV